MAKNKTWTKEEYGYLQDKWGTVPVEHIAAHLGRSINAIYVKKNRLKLGGFLDNGDYVTWHQLLIALNKSGGDSYKLISWIKNREFPVKYKKVYRNNFKVVYFKDFWKWADKNRTIIDWSKVEQNALGYEPDWVKVQRMADFQKNAKVKTTPWTKAEDLRLKDLLKKYKYSYQDLSKILHRTDGAIQRRILDLNLKERPLKADNHVKWTNEEYSKLSEMIKKGFSYELISEHIGKSAKAIRGRVYNMYLTENLDKVVAMIGNGTWGDGRPERPITSRLLSADEKLKAKKDMTQFVGILKGIICSHYDSNNYWQRDLCMKWDDVCTAGETDCDSCTSFVRIQPQYCRRCGTTIINRKKVDMCDRCKTARKKQYQHKYMALQGMNVGIKGGSYGESERIIPGRC